MSAVHVSEISMEREPASAPAARIHVSEIALLRTAPDPPGATVEFARIAMTLGIAPPSGGVSRRVGGVWMPYVVKARYNGAWI